MYISANNLIFPPRQSSSELTPWPAEMSGGTDSFLDLEKHRLRLEDSVKQLQKALQHWQTWDAEYEALKEEVEAVSETGHAAELLRIHDEFEGELLNQKEISEIFGPNGSKTRDQIINLLERRIDYVSKNVESLQKQLETAENKYAAASVLSHPDAADENGQPITDIIEQLDEDDNVVSYRLHKPSDTLPQVREALEKAGVKDLPESETEALQQISKLQTTRGDMEIEDGATKSTPQHDVPISKPTSEPKKIVSFSEDTKVSEEPQPDITRRAKRVEHIMQTAKEQEKMSVQEPVIPEDEDEDDATLRQDMLKYGMGEIGAVVAELELEEGNSEDDDSGFEYGDDDFDDFDEDEDDEEDQYGRYKGQVITDKYRQRMLELEKKLGIKSRSSQAMEKQEEEQDSNSDTEGIGRIVISHASAAPSKTSKPAPSKSIIKERGADASEGKKGVRFAQNLDIAPEESTPIAPTRDEPPPKIEPLGDIVERSSSSKPVESKPATKSSRFRKSRGETASADNIPKGPMDIAPQFVDQDRPKAPTGPDGATIVDTLVEREATSAPLPPDELNDAMVHQEVADEHQRLRRKFIQRQGGFLKEDESPIQPLDDVEDGQEPMSRFKAARLSRQ